MKPGEEGPVCSLVGRVFDEFVAPDCSPEGVREFLRYAEPGAMLNRVLGGDHFILVAVAHERIVGMIEMRECYHICLCFVDRAYQARGIGRSLWSRALDTCVQRRPGLCEVDVNSSLFAVPFYERLGFRTTGPEQVNGGIRFVPMNMVLCDAP
jgi:ribosomal protein S18 acetylase RimI-like enzyme